MSLFFWQICSASSLDFPSDRKEVRYLYVDFARDLDLVLTFCEDSTFVMQDYLGNEQMIQYGRWRELDSNRILLEADISNISLVQSGLYGKVNREDSVCYYRCSEDFLYMRIHSFSPIVKDTIYVSDSPNVSLRGFLFQQLNGEYKKKDKIEYGIKWFYDIYGQYEGIDSIYVREFIKKSVEYRSSHY